MGNCGYFTLLLGVKYHPIYITGLQGPLQESPTIKKRVFWRMAGNLSEWKTNNMTTGWLYNGSLLNLL